MRPIFAYSISLAIAAFSLNIRAADIATETAPVFVGGQEGYPVYRIPAALVAANGDILAFAEARQKLDDTSGNDLVLKRSKDNGRTWSALQVVAEDGDASLNNPCAVVVRETGRILLVYQRYPAGLDERSVVPGIEGDNIVRVLITHSDDHGATWSAPRDITRNAKPAADVTSVASGPGNGIQLRHGPFTGRILFPFNHGPYGEWKVYAVFSDDSGETWSYGAPAAEGSPGRANEVQFVETDAGYIQLFARSFSDAKRRKTTFSIDSGLSWAVLTSDVRELVDPGCMGSILHFDNTENGGQSGFLYSGPNDPKRRINGTIWMSLDDCRTWPIKVMIHEGPFAYSHLVRTADSFIGCLYETGDASPYERISFARIAP